MAFTFNSISHFFAKSLKVLVTGLDKVALDAPKVATAIEKAEGAKPEVEAVTSALGGAEFVPLEDAVFAIAGSVVSLLNAAGEAAAQKLLDAGLDIVAVNAGKSVISQLPTLSAVAKSL